jgi:hypothetical protein
MGKSEQGKGGGARKIGRNKKKCEKYRFTHSQIEGNKKPKGIGNVSTRPRVLLPWEKGTIIDLHMMNEDRIPEFRPVRPRHHLALELIETGKKRGGFKRAELILAGESLTRTLRDPRALCRVRTMPRRETTTSGPNVKVGGY